MAAKKKHAKSTGDDLDLIRQVWWPLVFEKLAVNRRTKNSVDEVRSRLGKDLKISWWLFDEFLENGKDNCGGRTIFEAVMAIYGHSSPVTLSYVNQIAREFKTEESDDAAFVAIFLVALKSMKEVYKFDALDEGIRIAEETLSKKKILCEEVEA